jgi:hypothetical protein
MQVTGVDQSYLLGLFGSTSGGTTTTPDLTTLAVMANNPLSSAQVAAATQPTPPTTPWSTQETAKQASANVQSALAGHNNIGTSTALTSNTNTTASPADAKAAPFNQDYQKLFNLYQGLSTLMDIATQAQSKTITPVDQSQLAKAFQAGLTQVSSYIDATKFNNLRLALGGEAASETSSLKIDGGIVDSNYVSAPLANDLTSDVANFDGNVQFNIAVKRSGATINVPIDLSGMGSAPRSLANVITYMNQQLSAAGVDTRFASNLFPAQPQTITVGKNTVTLGPGQNQYGYQVKVAAGETVSFSAPQTAGAIYLSQIVGDPDPDHDPTTNDGHTQAQLLKFQTDTTNVPSPLQTPGQANFVDGRVFAQNLDPNVVAVHATQVGPDGSVYQLADVKGTVDGQAIQGSQDVALLKYDSAGHLIYTRTLGASGSATGLSLAVSASGQVAVAGAVTGSLLGTTDGALNSGDTGSFASNSDSFVTLYDSSGQEMWTERRGARLDDQANQLAFGADGTLYVAGQAQGQMPGATSPIGGQDGYIEAFKTDASGNPTTAFTQSFGTTGADKPQGMVVNGTNLITASVESGHAVLRSFDISSGTPVQTATRDLGDLQGGSIAGLTMNGGQLVVAGTTANGALAAGTVTRAASGGSDAFVAQVSADLSSQPTDAIAYYGGSGNDRATSVAVSGSQVFIAGVAGTDLPGQPAVGKQDGFLAGIDVASGAITWSRRFSGQDGVDATAAIAADPTGASVLDKLGLPNGTLTTTDPSQQLAAQSSLRPGDQFTIKTGAGIAQTVTIDPGETFDSLVTKINRASGFEATASVFHNLDGTVALKIVPTYGQVTVQLGPGPLGKDALPTLGLAEGDINLTTTTNGKTVPADGGSKIYGLGLSSNLNLNDASQISHALAQVSSAMGVVRTAFQDVTKIENPPANNPGQTGSVPAYLTNQIANLQAGLARLTGGQSSSTTSLLA